MEGDEKSCVTCIKVIQIQKWDESRLLSGVIYMTKSRGPRTEPWGGGVTVGIRKNTNICPTVALHVAFTYFLSPSTEGIRFLLVVCGIYVTVLHLFRDIIFLLAYVFCVLSREDVITVRSGKVTQQFGRIRLPVRNGIQRGSTFAILQSNGILFWYTLQTCNSGVRCIESKELTGAMIVTDFRYRDIA